MVGGWNGHEDLYVVTVCTHELPGRSLMSCMEAGFNASHTFLTASHNVAIHQRMRIQAQAQAHPIQLVHIEPHLIHVELGSGSPHSTPP